MDNNKYYESFKIVDIKINEEQKACFDYASPSSIHSEVTDWAYGQVLSRKCYDLSDKAVLNGEFFAKNINGFFYLKIIACLPDWEKYVNSLKITVNGKEIVNEKEVFFENVNLGWPGLYFVIPEGCLLKGTNKITFQTENENGAGLYFSEAKILILPKMKNFSQVSNVKNVKENGVFGIAVKYDGKDENVKIIKESNCHFIKSKLYNGFVLFSFKAEKQGKTTAVIQLSNKKIRLSTPNVIVNNDSFLIGIDSDDHRHDETEELIRIPLIFAFTEMGNFFQFRPQKERNYYQLAGKETFENIIEILSMFGIKIGLCDTNNQMPFVPEMGKENFYGYHVHEPYLFFNILSNYSGFFKSETQHDGRDILVSESFGQSKKIYFDYLRTMVDGLPKNCGLISVGSPSMLCSYEGDAGFDRITIEPVSNINLLTGAVRSTSVKVWGAHLPPDWYFGVPVDKVKANKFRLALQYLYLNGASYVYAENSTFKTNAFERCDWESPYCVFVRQYLREFNEYALNNPREGKLLVDKAIVYGNDEFFMWQTNDRMAELKEKDWDSAVWGKWDNSYHECWQASEAWLPYSKKQSVFYSPLNKFLFAGTPYGNVDVVSIEKDFSQYKTLAFLGWNTMTDEILDKIKDYVYNGGNLVISYCQFNYADRNDVEPVYPSADKLKDFLGVDIKDKKPLSGIVSYSDGKSFEVEGDAYAVVGDLCGAETIAKDLKGTPVVIKNNYGKGVVYLCTFYNYYNGNWSVGTVKHALHAVVKDGDVFCNNKNVSFTVRELEKGKYKIDVLNMNCIEDDVEKFVIEFKGKVVEGKVKVGEIKEYII